MKIRFYCYQPVCSDGTLMNVSRNAVLLGKDSETVRMYNSYLLSALDTDFPSHHPELADDVIEDIARIERGEIETAEWGGEGFCHSLTRDTVTFEHAVFGECPEWPIWSCPLSHYKAALLGWRRFIDMPQAIETELIIELPNVQKSSQRTWTQ